MTEPSRCILALLLEPSFTTAFKKECVEQLAREVLPDTRFREIFSDVGESAFRAAGEQLAKAQGEGVSVVSVLDDSYPSALRQTAEPPAILYVDGCLPEWSGPRAQRRFAAIVGTRRATTYGQNTAYRIARELTERGIAVVSGLAFGIDTAAHRGACEGMRRALRGSSSSPGVAVLGSGVRCIYPRENERLSQELIQLGGALVSEYGPWDGPRQFPSRLPSPRP